MHSKQNPADNISRDASPADLLKTNLWWHGPDYLSLENYSNCTQPKRNRDTTDTPEKRKICTLAVTVNVDYTMKVFHKFSSIEKLRRVITYCVKFVKIIKNKGTMSAI